MLEGREGGEKVSKFTLRKHVLEHLDRRRYFCNVCSQEVSAHTFTSFVADGGCPRSTPSRPI